MQFVIRFVAGGGKNPAKGTMPLHGTANLKFRISQNNTSFHCHCSTGGEKRQRG
uniref:Uncharacterized protein n=1 Tax=Caudovirales sp. ctCpR1 TaxID=2825760 RepID=A0A8S5V930_9CAUD|nr:MAG TPA: hypothetical protein [Caudovirales sp. ctCpR1]